MDATHLHICRMWWSLSVSLHAVLLPWFPERCRASADLTGSTIAAKHFPMFYQILLHYSWIVPVSLSRKNKIKSRVFWCRLHNMWEINAGSVSVFQRVHAVLGARETTPEGGLRTCICLLRRWRRDDEGEKGAHTLLESNHPSNLLFSSCSGLNMQVSHDVELKGSLIRKVRAAGLCQCGSYTYFSQSGFTVALRLFPVQPSALFAFNMELKCT